MVKPLMPYHELESPSNRECSSPPPPAVIDPQAHFFTSRSYLQNTQASCQIRSRCSKDRCWSQAWILLGGHRRKSSRSPGALSMPSALIMAKAKSTKQLMLSQLEESRQSKTFYPLPIAVLAHNVSPFELMTSSIALYHDLRNVRLSSTMSVLEYVPR